MPLYSPNNSPEANLAILKTIDYPGRLLVIGRVSTERVIQLYAIGGRSDDSKNRILVEEDNVVSTETFDKTKPPKKPQLTIYDAMRRVGDRHIVSNGDQTSTVIQFARSGRSFKAAMQARRFEPDKPNYTPRISAYSDVRSVEGEPGFGISVMRKNPDTGGVLREFYWEGDEGLEPDLGIGYGVHTYTGSGNPLPSFDEKPFAIPLPSSVDAAGLLLWDSLNPDTRVAVAARGVDSDGHTETAIINLHE